MNNSKKEQLVQQILEEKDIHPEWKISNLKVSFNLIRRLQNCNISTITELLFECFDIHPEKKTLCINKYFFSLRYVKFGKARELANALARLNLEVQVPTKIPR